MKAQEIHDWIIKNSNDSLLVHPQEYFEMLNLMEKLTNEIEKLNYEKEN